MWPSPPRRSVTHGTLHAPETAVALVGVVVMAALMRRRFTGAIVMGILLSTHGIGYGFLTFVVIKLLSGRAPDVHPLMYATAAAFAGYFIAF